MTVIEVYSPKGNLCSLTFRNGTSDLSTIGSTWMLWGKTDDEYGLRDLPPLSGYAIDIGAHIGSVALALLADHPDLRVIAVEPLSENVEVMQASAEANGWTDRLTIHTKAIGKGKTADISWNFDGPEYLTNHRFIGGLSLGSTVAHETRSVPTTNLTALTKGIAEVDFLKTDCEGCEFDLLADKAVAKVKVIVGEGHPADWLDRVHEALDDTHEVEVISDQGGPGLFRAVRRG